MGNGIRAVAGGDSPHPSVVRLQAEPSERDAPTALAVLATRNPAMLAKGAALIDPAVGAVVLAEACPMYVADSEGRVILTTPALDTLHALAEPGAPISSSTLIVEALDRLRGGEDRVELDHAFEDDDRGRGIRSVHRRSVTHDGRTIYVGVYSAGHDDGEAETSAKTQFLGKMSHEMRTPLNAIIGFAEMSLREVHGALGDRYRGYFDDIRGAAQGLLRTIEQILQAVDAQTARHTPDLRPTSVAGAIVDASARASEEALRKGIDIKLPQAHHGLRVMADPDYLHQIIDHLLGNAVKFTETGGRVGIEARRDASGMIDLAVWDTGSGIPSEEKDRVFEMFEQTRADLFSAPREGTGLGLALSRHFAQAMNGELFLDSEPGIGSRFTLRLPPA